MHARNSSKQLCPKIQRANSSQENNKLRLPNLVVGGEAISHKHSMRYAKNLLGGDNEDFIVCKKGHYSTISKEGWVDSLVYYPCLLLRHTEQLTHLIHTHTH